MARFYAGIGARKTPVDVCIRMRKLASVLEKEGFVLRSGAAHGADTAFESGVSSRQMKEIYLPWPRFNDHPSHLCNFSSSIVAMACELVAPLHPAWSRLSRGSQRLMVRNVYQVLGSTLDIPVKFVICWTPDGCDSKATYSSSSGGTGVALALADSYSIPIFNLQNPAWTDEVIMAFVHAHCMED